LCSFDSFRHNVGNPTAASLQTTFWGELAMSNQDRLEEPCQPTESLLDQPKSQRAKASFMFGLASFFVSILAGVPAIINGLLGLREIQRSGGQLQGESLAVSGIVLGMLGSMASGSLIWYGVAKVQRASRNIGMI
jgi:hypothetical protein